MFTDELTGNDIIAIPLTHAGEDVVIDDDRSSAAVFVPPSGTDDLADGLACVNSVSTDPSASAAAITDIMVNEYSPGITENDTVSDTLYAPSTGPSQLLSVSFDQIMPLPKRERSVSKRARPKPPSYELTGDATMQFVLDRVHSGKKKVKNDEKKTKKRKLVKNNEVETKSTVRRGASRKKSKDSTVDVVPCALCKVRKCDDEIPRSWTQCQSCLEWYHNECQGLEENEPVGRFVCVECEDTG